MTDGTQGGRPFIEMTAGFERHEQRAATGVRTRRFERENFRVGKTGPEMISLADDPSMVDDHGSDHRIGARRALGHWPPGRARVSYNEDPVRGQPA